MTTGPFHIYGRMSYEKPLTFVEALEARDSIADEALRELGREGWVELIAVPAGAWIQVIGEGDDG